MYVADIIRDLMREISERGTIEVLIGEIEGIASREKQERLLLEERERMLTIVAELRKTIADKRASYEEREGRLTRQLTLTRVHTDDTTCFVRPTSDCTCEEAASCVIRRSAIDVHSGPLR